MSDLSTYPLRLPRSIRAGVERLSKQDGVCINQFVSIAVENYRAQVMSADGLGTPPQPGQRVGSILGAEILSPAQFEKCFSMAQVVNLHLTPT